jgi:bifunctional DNase/RNase
MLRWLKQLLFGAPPLLAPLPARRCERCESPQVFHLTTVSRSGEVSEAHLCEVCARTVLFEPYPVNSPPQSQPDEVPVEVERVVISEADDNHFLVFREIAGERRLSFVLGIFEATVISRIVTRMPSPRPLTHDAWLSTVAALGAVVLAVCIHDRQEATYFAEVRLDRSGELVRVDVRPSDGVSMALKAGAPFLIANPLLAAASSPQR